MSNHIDATATNRRSMFVAAFGAIIEWYDFSVFFFVAAILQQEFFSGRNSLLLTLGIGAAGFVFRPVGAVILGQLGDKIGRKQVLVISGVLMSISMFGIALIPGQSIIGMWGGIGVVFFRCLAGFSVGAEYTGIMIFLTESVQANRRGLAASWAAANSEIGLLLAIGLSALITNLLSPHAATVWGWRLLFGIGGALAALMVPLRSQMREPATFSRHQREAAELQEISPLRQVLRYQRRAIIVTFLISVVGSASYFVNISYMPTYLVEVVHMKISDSLIVGIPAAVVAIPAALFAGIASDYIGRKKAMSTLLGVMLITTIPAYAALLNAGPTFARFAAAGLASLAAGWSAVAASAAPEQFTVDGRSSGMAIGYNVGTVLFGGLSPIFVVALIQTSESPLAPAIYLTVIVFIAGILILWLARDMTACPDPEYHTPPGDRTLKVELNRSGARAER
jgi:MHS family proline/betaine transporter-like MFS transporter